MKVYKIQFDNGGAALIVSDPDEIHTIMDEADIGDVYTITVMEMTEQDFMVLGEFDGF